MDDSIYPWLVMAFAMALSSWFISLLSPHKLDFGTCIPEFASHSVK
jgi:hypothetical protein